MPVTLKRFLEELLLAKDQRLKDEKRTKSLQNTEKDTKDISTLTTKLKEWIKISLNDSQMQDTHYHVTYIYLQGISCHESSLTLHDRPMCACFCIKICKRSALCSSSSSYSAL